MINTQSTVAKAARINDPSILEKLRGICFTEQDLRAGWIGVGRPETDVEEFKPLAKWALEHWQMYRTFLDEADSRKAYVLDIGCGIGHSTLNLSALSPGWRIEGVDLDHEAIQFAKKYNSADNITFLAQDIFYLSSKKKYNYIFALEIFEHLPPELHRLFIEKLLSLLEPNGKIFFTTPNSLDEPDADYGHVGFLSRERAKVFYQIFKNNIRSSSFINNQKLLSKSLDGVIVHSPFSAFEKDVAKKSHFWLIFTALEGDTFNREQWEQRLQRAMLVIKRREDRRRLKRDLIRPYYRFRMFAGKLRDRVLGRYQQTISLEIPVNWHEDFIVHLASVLRPKVYVELGLYQCALFNKIIPHADQLIGIDIVKSAGEFMDKSDKTTFFKGTTDAFAAKLKKKPIQIDLLFIDADHSQKSVLNDFKQLFPYVADQGVILLHDGYPKNKEYTQPGYCGDGYKAIAKLSKERDDFELMTIPVHPGLSLCRKRSKQVSW